MLRAPHFVHLPRSLVLRRLLEIVIQFHNGIKNDLFTLRVFSLFLQLLLKFGAAHLQQYNTTVSSGGDSLTLGVETIPSDTVRQTQRHSQRGDAGQKGCQISKPAAHLLPSLGIGLETPRPSACTMTGTMHRCDRTRV